MKKILLFSFILVFIPFLFFSFFKQFYFSDFSYNDDIQIRVKLKNGIIMHIPLEKYVIGVVAGEMPLSFHDEALKAQSVAARTYALRRIINNKENDYDVVDSTLNQVYLDDAYLRNAWGYNYNEYIDRLTNIVSSTRSMVITYNGEIIDALYFSTSSGITENSIDVFGYDVPYLLSVDSSWDVISPAFSTVKTISKNVFFSTLNLDYTNNVDIKILNKTSTGRICKISINGNIFDASFIVSKFNLKSYYFEITYDESNIFVKTYGYGHGVGMSQYGAEAMSQKGYNYQDIIKYYYRDVKIVEL